jgi:ferrous iron transport protein B
MQSGLLDIIAKKLSVPSKLLFSILLGFGCTTLAVCSLESIPDKKQRNKIALLLSFIPCSAMLPLIMLLLLGVLAVPFYVVFLVYLISIFVGLLFAFLIKDKNSTRQSPHQSPTEYITACPLLFPNIPDALRQSIYKTLLFTKKIAVAFVVSAFVIVILARFTFQFKYTADSENSILFYICGVWSPIFKPVGLDNPAIICALLFGIIAKESAISVLLLFPEIVSGLSVASAVSLLVFYTLYPVCVSCCMAISQHCSKKTMPRLFVYNLIIAYLFSFFIYNFCAIL